MKPAVINRRKAVTALAGTAVAMIVPASALPAAPDVELKTWPRSWWFWQVDADNMEPSFRPGDWLGVIPLDAYEGEGEYLIRQLGATCVYRIGPAGTGGFHLSSDNPLYSSHKTPFVVPHDWFRAHVVGRVRAVIYRRFMAAMIGL